MAAPRLLPADAAGQALCPRPAAADAAHLECLAERARKAALLSWAFLRRYVLAFGDQGLTALLSLFLSLWLIRRGLEAEFGAYLFWMTTALITATFATALTSVHLYRLRPHPLAGRRSMERTLLSATLALTGLATLATVPAVALLGDTLGLWGAILFVPGTVLGFYARALAASRGELGWAFGISLAVMIVVVLGLMVGAALGQPSTANEVLVLSGISQSLASIVALVRLSAGIRPDAGRANRRRWRALLRHSGWPLFGGLAGEVSTRIYVYAVAGLAGTAAMGNLAAGQTLLRPATLLAGAFAAAARSALASRRHEGDRAGFLRTVWLGACGPAVVTLILGGSMAALWPYVSAIAYGGRFPDLAGTVLLWTANMAISCFVYVFGVGLQSLGRLRAAAWADVASAGTIALLMPPLLWFLPPASALFAMITGGLVQVALQIRALHKPFR